ncbi:MAG: hypothetical protein H8E39_01375 [Alphaproteobacteria bacterium]|nr:hypothetical protein [Alphaproteobacteria bacterium]
MVSENYEDSKMPETMATFVDLVSADMSEGVLDFSKLQGERYIDFWKYLCIAEEINEEKEFQVTFWGTGLVENCGKEMTGKAVNAEDFGVEFGGWAKNKCFSRRCTDCKTIIDRRVSYFNGTVDWENRNYVKWHQFFGPLIKNNKKGWFSLMCFN